MNALNNKTNEPSMEEILASIRRIISDDEDRIASTVSSAVHETLAQSAPAPAAPAPAAPAPEAAQPSYVPPAYVPPLVQPAPVYVQAAPAYVQPPVQPQPQPQVQAQPQPRLDPPPSRSFEPAPRASQERVVSGDTVDAVSHAFRTLDDTARSKGPLTLEQVVVETVRPMLREWLDANLPGLVKEMVRDEIERLARRARG